MKPALESSHVVVDSDGRAWIDETNVKVIEVLRDHLAYGWSPEEIHWQQPGLSLAQIYAALAYYHDHRALVDGQIRESVEVADAAARRAGESALARRLRHIGTASE